MEKADWEAWARIILKGCTGEDGRTDELIMRASAEQLMSVLAKIVKVSNVRLMELPDDEGIGVFGRRG